MLPHRMMIGLCIMRTKGRKTRGAAKMSEANKAADDVNLPPFLGRTVKASDINGNQVIGQLKAINKDHLTLYDAVSGWIFLPRHQLKNMTVSVTDDPNSLSLENLQDKTLPEMLMLLKYRPVQIRQNDAEILQGLLVEVGDYHLVLTRHNEVVYVSTEHILSIRYGTNDNGVSYQPIALQSEAFDSLSTQSVSKDEPIQRLDAGTGTIEAMPVSAEGEADDGASNNNQEIDGNSNYTPNYTPNYSPSYQATTVSQVSESQSYQNVYSPITNSNNEGLNQCETPINSSQTKLVHKEDGSTSSNRKTMKKKKPALSRRRKRASKGRKSKTPYSKKRNVICKRNRKQPVKRRRLNAARSVISKTDSRKA
ncbi:hypothetical protein QFZ78_005648 [Paenibacillus sp. V4I5]|nr:hypothetical protein [Paenibacillus sp. V4I5]